jgi:hypothetical protein
MKIGGADQLLPGTNRGTEIRPAIFGCDALHNFLGEACSTLRIGPSLRLRPGDGCPEDL